MKEFAGGIKSICIIPCEGGAVVVCVGRQEGAQAKWVIDSLTFSRVADELGLRKGVSAPRALSAREWEVLQLIRRGATNREIAATLNLSENTVKSYVSNLLDKLGVNSRTQAAVAGLASGPRLAA